MNTSKALRGNFYLAMRSTPRRYRSTAYSALASPDVESFPADYFTSLHDAGHDTARTCLSIKRARCLWHSGMACTICVAVAIHDQSICYLSLPVIERKDTFLAKVYCTVFPDMLMFPPPKKAGARNGPQYNCDTVDH